MKGYVCSVCGYISIDGTIPEKCPYCGAPKKAFKEDLNAIVEPTKDTDKVELNKKHIPAIIVEKKCGLIPDGCIDVHIKIGEILHPMLMEHSILFVDSYLDKKLISRTKFLPLSVNPATCLHLKSKSGKLSVVSHCNLHGAWLSETDI